MKKLLFICLACATISLSNAQELKFGKVSKEELQETVYDKDSTADAAYIYRYRKTYLDYMEGSGFNTVTEIHNRIKIYTQEGVNLATEKIYFYKPDSKEKDEILGLKGYTFNLENGKVVKEKVETKEIIEEKLNDTYSVKKVPFSSVKIGSVLDIKYKQVSPYISIDDLNFQFGIPVKRLDYKVIVPSFYKYSKKGKGYYFINPTVEKNNAKTNFSQSSRSSDGTYQRDYSQMEYYTEAFIYQADDVPAIKENEPYVASLAAYRGGVDYELTSIQYPNSKPKYFSNTWEKISKDIYESSSFGGELKKSGYYQDELPSVISGAASPIEKIIKIHQFVKSKVKWNGRRSWYPQHGGRKAYKDGEGNVADINLMLTSMLKSAGLDANPVLVSTKSNGIPVYPTRNGFNYVVSSVTLGNGGIILLDATDMYLEPGQIQPQAMNWNGRMIMKDGFSKWVNLTSNKYGIEDHQISVKLSEEGSVEGMLRSKYYNINAYAFRKKYNHVSEEQLIENLEDKYQIEIDNFRQGNKLKLDKAASQMMKFSSEDLVEEINDKLYVNPLLFFAKTTNPFKLDDRKFPVDFVSPWKDNFTVSMQIPAGYKVESLPEPLSIGMVDDLGIFTYKISEVNGVIKASVLLQINKGEVMPQYYQELKGFYNDVVKKQTEKVVLIKS